MIKKMISIVGAAAMIVGAPAITFANMWDTHQLSDARYGKATVSEGFTGITCYFKEGWLVLEWFNETGHVEDIEYYQVNGNDITTAQIAQFQEVNNMATIHWTKTSNGQNIWFSKQNESDFRFELDWDFSAKIPMQRLILSTFDGFIGMEKALKASNNGESATITDLPKVNI